MSSGISTGVGAGPMLSAPAMAQAVRAFVKASPSARSWDVATAFDWHRADVGRLTEGQRSAVRFITVVEDHIPGYFDLYRRHFPVDDTVDPITYESNRELYHFTVQWAHEEDRHALALAEYQLHSGMEDAAALRTTLAEEGQKRFEVPYREPVQFFTYALVQEKATQLFYQQLRTVVADDVLRDVLSRLSRDEARHFAFFADVVERYVAQEGDRVVPPMREVLETFRMPLADTMRNYWRWALQVADEVGGYDHTEAYEVLAAVVRRATDRARHQPLLEVEQLVRTLRRLP